MAEKMLFNFEGEFSLKGIDARDVKVKKAKGPEGVALRIDSGYAEAWPGITLPAPDGKWDLSAFQMIEMDVKNVGKSSVRAMIRVDNPGADGRDHCVQVGIDLKPGEAGVLRADLPHPLIDEHGEPVKLFGMRGYPGGSKGGATLDPANVTQLLVFVPRPITDHAFTIDNIRATGQYEPEVASAAELFPMIDRFGQYIHRQWPGKVDSVEDLRARVQAEAQDLQAHSGPRDWARYGGWATGPTLEATGFFRVQKYEGKWWLVDPEGKLFISHGVDCVRAGGDSTPLEDREHWYADLPDPAGPFGRFYGKGRSIHYYYKGRTPRTYDHSAANLLLKYGEDWRSSLARVTHQRLRSWGINTIANWSDSAIYLQRKTPYVGNIGFGSKMLEGSQGYWGKFRDAFDPSFAEGIRKRMAAEKGKSAGDPWCIGYFVDNEIAWGDDVSLATAALASPPDQAAKRAFIAELRDKYATIERLNEAWDTEHESWDALLQCTQQPDRRRAAEDLKAFYTKTAETYFKTIRDAVKESAPDQLYLGCRFAWVNPLAVAAAAKYCDVVSYNLYRPSVADFKVPGDHDVPLIIGEFHFGALDRGLFHTGLVPVKDQQARAEAYKSYVQGMLAHPQFVGCHWFKYRDESTTGRALDAENYQIGFIDICDTPYPETIAAVREVGYGMYDYRQGVEE